MSSPEVGAVAKKKHKKKHNTHRNPIAAGVQFRSMDEALHEVEQLLEVASRTEAEAVPRELRSVESQLNRLAGDLELARRRLEAVRPTLEAARQRLAQLEAAAPALIEARTRLRALEAASADLDKFRTRVHTLSPGIESARRALETSEPAVLPETRRQMRTLATELQAASHSFASPAPILDALRGRVRALEALDPLLATARDEVNALEALDPVLEATRLGLRELATELEAPRRALEAAVAAYQQTDAAGAASPTG